MSNCLIHKDQKITQICKQPECIHPRLRCDECTDDNHTAHSNWLVSIENFNQLTIDQFSLNINHYKKLLNIQQDQLSDYIKTILWELQKSISLKMIQLEKQTNQIIEQIANYSQLQLDFIGDIEEIINKQKSLPELSSQKLTTLSSLLQEGVEQNLNKWTVWKEKNVSLMIEEIKNSQFLIKPFFEFQLKQFTSLDGEVKESNHEEEKMDFMFSQKVLAGTFKNQFEDSSTYLVQIIKGINQQVYSSIQLEDESIVTASFEGAVKVWNGTTYDLEFSSSLVDTCYFDLVEIKIDTYQSCFAASNEDGTIKLFARKEDEEWLLVKELPKVKEGCPFHLAYDEGNNLLFYNTQRNGKVIQAFDLQRFKVSKKVKLYISYAQFPHKFTQDHAGTSIALIAKQEHFVTSDIRGQFIEKQYVGRYIYKFSYGQANPVIKVRGHQNCINKIVVLKDMRIATCCQDGVLKIWPNSLQGGKAIYCFENRYPLWSLCSVDKLLIFGDVEGNIIFYFIDPFTLFKKIKGHQKGITFIKQGQDNKFVTSSEDMNVKVWKY